MKLNPNLKTFWKTKSRIKVLYGGRASSKTHDATGMLVFLSQKYKMKVLCTRQFQNKIAESVYTTLKNKIDEARLNDRYTITDNRIVCKDTGSEFIFYGLWRNIDEIKSLENIDICYIEEAHSLTQEQWDILEPTIRKEGSEFWIIFNPRLRTDFIYKNFVINKQTDSVVRKINYDENPFLSETMKSIIQDKKEKDYEDYRHIYLGEPKTEDINSLFNYEELENSMKQGYDPLLEDGVTIYGLDVARFGDDTTVFARRKGYVITKIEERKKFSTVETASWIANSYLQEQVDAVVVDTIGVGGGVFDILSNQGVFCVSGNASNSADEPKYANKRAEMYFRLKETLSIGLKLPYDEELLEELMATTYMYNTKGQIQIQSKDKIKETLGRSPDKADAVALTFFANIAPKMLEDDWHGGY